jgi:FixJ family two-component response regulator
MPMIFVTRLCDDTIRARTQKAGGAGFLAKPIDVKELIACINKALMRDEP